MIVKNFNSGVYCILNKINNYKYIGSASSINQKNNSGFYKRSSQHYSALLKNTHYNQYLQRSFNKYGKENFEFKILAICPSEYCIKLEQWFIDTQKPEYNICKIAGSVLGRIVTNETKLKLSKALKGKPFTIERINKIKEANKNSEYRKIRMKEAGKIRKRTVEGNLANRDKRRLSKSITKLTINQVKEIKEKLINGIAQKELALYYNISCSTINDIKNKRTWSDINI
jgi:group I intron endonuclease